MQKKYSVYFALLFALVFAYTIDTLLPVKYFTTNAISGFPLIQLGILFTLIMLSLYAVQQNLHKDFHLLRNIPSKIRKISTRYFPGNNLIPKAVLIGSIFYLYALCFIVWEQLPANLVDLHTQDYRTPWYVYSIRLGITGIIGVVSVLSYAFRRFEKEVLVFGIIIIIALFAGPYYYEQRFDKYVMVGMIGFASLLVFKFLHLMTRKWPILNGIIISSLVVAASISTLMYVGFNALTIQTGDYANALGRRNFPTEQEMNTLDLLRSKILFGSNQTNIVSYPNEYNPLEGGIMTKLHAFSGLPIVKIPQTHYLLNASTLDSFYYLIEKSNTRYILIPSNSTSQPTLGNPARFAFENFQQYDDHNYLLVNVPSLHGPSAPSESELGIVYKKDGPFEIPLTDKKKLAFSNYDFNSKENDTEFIQVNNENQSEKATVYGYKKQGGKTIWSKDLEPGINYIDSMFRIRGENKTSDDRAGIKWREGSNTYTVSISNRGLELRRQLSSDHPTVLLSQNSEIKRNDWEWYSLKIENLQNSINVYVDDLLKIKIPREPLEMPKGIAKVAVYSAKNSVEFEPIEVAKIGTSEETLLRTSNYENYYPISSLALSGSKYSTFAEGDYSVFSENTVVIPFDPLFRNDTLMNDYLNYVKSGGTLVVINSDGNFDGSFSKLLSIQGTSNKTEKFTDIVKGNETKVSLNVSGYVRDSYFRPSNDTNIIAYYRNDQNKLVGPFIIEKNLTGSGRIIYVNAKGYFDAIYDNPKKYFASLKDFSKLIDSTPSNSTSIFLQNASRLVRQFIGNVDLSGRISINGSSFSIINSQSNSQNITVGAASVLDKNGNLINRFNNFSIVNMNLSGQYDVSIDSLGNLSIPGPLSQRDYIHITLPNKSNVTMMTSDNNNSNIEILFKNNTSTDTIKLNDKSKIVLQIDSTSPQNSISVTMKNPLITVNGSLNLKESNLYASTNYTPLNVFGHAKVMFGFTDDFKEFNGTRTRVQYLGHLQSLSVDGITKQISPTLKFPGQILNDLKKKGQDVPLIRIVSSLSNVALVIAISIGTIILIWYTRKMFLRRQ